MPSIFLITRLAMRAVRRISDASSSDSDADAATAKGRPNTHSHEQHQPPAFSSHSIQTCSSPPQQRQQRQYDSVPELSYQRAFPSAVPTEQTIPTSTITSSRESRRERRWERRAARSARRTSRHNERALRRRRNCSGPQSGVPVARGNEERSGHTRTLEDASGSETEYDPQDEWGDAPPAYEEVSSQGAMGIQSPSVRGTLVV